MLLFHLAMSVDPTEKWTFSDSIKFSSEGILLEEIFHVTRGLATGNNDFFLLDEEEILKDRIDPNFLIPILPGPRDIHASIIEPDSSGKPDVDNKRYLLSITQSPEEIQKKFPSIHDYLQEGLKQGVHKGYLCQSRKVWYFQEKRAPPLFLATYMGRDNANEKSSIRFILNRSNALATNSYICLYPKPTLRRFLLGHNSREEELLEALNSISKKPLKERDEAMVGDYTRLSLKSLDL
jgi:hypothetical protein